MLNVKEAIEIDRQIASRKDKLALQYLKWNDFL